jgi:hypothetical protein
MSLAQPVSSPVVETETHQPRPRPVSLKLGPLTPQRRSFLPIILVILVLAGMAVGGNYLFGPYFGYTLDYSTPQATIRTWAAAVKSANPKVLSDCYSEIRKSIISSQDQAGLEDNLKHLNGSLIKLDIIDSRITGRTARVIVTFVGKGADGIIRSQSDEVALVEESGKWKLDAEDVTLSPTIIGLTTVAKNSSVLIDPFAAPDQSGSGFPRYFQSFRADESLDVDNPQYATGREDGRYCSLKPGGELVLTMPTGHYFKNGNGQDIRIYAKTTGRLDYRAWVRNGDHKWLEIDSSSDAPELIELAGLNVTRADALKIRNTGHSVIYIDAVEAFYVDDSH